MSTTQDSVKSLMTSRFISVLPETPILAVINIILANNFNGVPVVDRLGILVGIITKYDLIINRASIRDDMKARDVMNKDPLTLVETNSVDDAIRAFSEHHKVDPIPVVDVNHKIIGILSRYDMVRLFQEYGITSPASNKRAMANKSSSFGGWFVVVIIVVFIVLTYLFIF